MLGEAGSDPSTDVSKLRLWHPGLEEGGESLSCRGGDG